nr:MAG: ORF1 [TTV-like mini virus]
MPPYRRYYQSYYYRNRRRRYRNRFRRPRKAFRRRYWRTKYRRRRPKVKKYRKRKLKKLILKVFQPKSIKKCKIKGMKCLFQGAIERANNNYIQYIYDTVNDRRPGGGGWSLQVFSLESLFEEYEHLLNIWTTSNAALPLVRYRGCKFRFYQSNDTDYVVKYDNCWPMVDTKYTHADSAPQRMLRAQHKIVVPSRKSQTRKKPYKQVFIRPPSQMTNNWYFQRDICKTPLAMLTTTAVDLRNPFAAPEARSNNVTLYSLNTFQFKNTNFQQPDPQKGYHYKTEGTQKYYLYAAHTNSTTWGDLIPLTNTKDNQPGKQLRTIINNNNSQNKLSNWGNPFHHTYTPDDFKFYFMTKSPADIQKDDLNKPLSQTGITEFTSYLYYQLRYNPEKDTGDTNKVYLVSNLHETNWNEPENPNLILEGFPLFILLWGWVDWQKKLKQVSNINNQYILVIKTKMFSENLNHYVLLDKDFIDGFEPYSPHDTNDIIPITPQNQQHWYPKFLFQEQSINTLCLSGSGCPRPPWNHYLQALCTYTFYFSFGGCPKQLEKVYDPCLQSKWPTADNIPSTTEIKNPNTAPQTELFSWDWEGDFVKTTAIQRIKEYTPSYESIFSSTGTKSDPIPLKEAQESQTQAQEEEKELFVQLQQLRHKRKVLQFQLNELLLRSTPQQ